MLLEKLEGKSFMYFPYKKMGNRNSGESSGQVAPADIEEGIALGANSWSSWMRLPTSLGASQEEPEDDDPCKCLNLSWSQRVFLTTLRALNIPSRDLKFF